MDSLVTKLTPRAIANALETLPTGTDTTYELALQRINDLNPDFGKIAKLFLTWVAYTYRPLHVREIEHATALLPDDNEIDADEIIPAKVLASMCAGLVIIDEMDNVRLCHYTVENYFQKVRGELFGDSEICLARTCLTYLLLDEFKIGRCLDEDFDRRAKTFPFLGYAASYWGRHAASNTDQSIEEKVMIFLKSDPHRNAAIQAIWYLNEAVYINWDAKSDVTGLHLSSYFGLIKATECLIAEHVDVNAQDSRGTTSLMYAAEHGHVAIVQKLLEAGANPNVVCSRGGNTLHRAVLEDHLGIVKLLLERKDVDVNTQHSRWGYLSALMIASEHGRIDIVKELLKRPDIRINDMALARNYSALTLAVDYNQLEVVKLLLSDPRTEVNNRDRSSWSPLMTAANFGFLSIIEELLDRGANIEQSDSELDGGGTAILRAVDGNHIAAVQLLYERGANWNCKDKYNRSLIHGAAVNNRASILQWMLEIQPGFDINLQDVNGKTALHDAAASGYTDCIKVLLEFHARTDILDKDGKTALRTAKELNQIVCYEILKKAREEQIGSVKRTDTLLATIEIPLTTAALIGDRARVIEFIDKAKTNPEIDLNEKEHRMGQTALAAAVRGDHAEIAALLISAGVDVNPLDRLARTPLHLCAMLNRYEIAKSLIAAHVDVNICDQWGVTALTMAQREEFYSLVILLLENGATINEDQEDKHDLLLRAAFLGSASAVKMLLDLGSDPLQKDSSGQTPYQVAKRKGHKECAQILLDFESKAK
jgi:ankyrin repeat domain-containing protein 50